MESNDNKLEAKSQSQTQSKPPRVKPQTRLQQQAPAALQLDVIIDPNPSSNAMAFSCSTIPLLSPLILSPQSQPEAAKERLLGVGEQSDNDNNNVSDGMEIMVGGGWVHPAMGTYVEAASMFDLFQSQCTLVHLVQ